MKKTLTAFSMEMPKGETDPCHAGFNMPVDVDIAQLVLANDGVVLLGMINPNAMRVWHPVIIVGLGLSYEPLIGHELGKCLGVIGMNNSIYAVYPDLPWPKSTIEGAKPMGQA